MRVPCRVSLGSLVFFAPGKHGGAACRFTFRVGFHRIHNHIARSPPSRANGIEPHPGACRAYAGSPLFTGSLTGCTQWKKNGSIEVATGVTLSVFSRMWVVQLAKR